jgi:hypothetical protein
MKLSEALRGVGRPVAYFPRICQALSGLTRGVLLCQLWYLQDTVYGGNEFFRSLPELLDETGMSEWELRQAREDLTRRGILRERYARLEHRLYFYIDPEQLDAFWESLAPGSPSEGSSDGETGSSQMARSNPLRSNQLGKETKEKTNEERESAATTVAASPPVPARVARSKARVPGVSFAPLIDAFRTRNVPPPLLSAPPEIKAAQHLLHAFSPEQLATAWVDYAGDFGDTFDHDHLSFAYLERESRMPRWERWCAAGRPPKHRAHPKSEGDIPRAPTQPRWNRPDADDLARYRAVDTDPIRILARLTRSRATDAPDRRPPADA